MDPQLASLFGNLVSVILGLLGIICLLPSLAFIPTVVITAIIGHKKQDYKYLKRFLFIWVGSVFGIMVILALYAVSNFVISVLATTA